MNTTGLSRDGFTLKGGIGSIKLVEKLVRAHTHLVMRESLDDSLRHLLPWDIEIVIDVSVDAMMTKRNPKFKVRIVVTHTDLIC